MKNLVAVSYLKGLFHSETKQWNVIADTLPEQSATQEHDKTRFPENRCIAILVTVTRRKNQSLIIEEIRSCKIQKTRRKNLVPHRNQQTWMLRKL